MNNKETYKVLGVMSGTSLDGLDLAFCTFEKEGDKWQYEITEAITLPYSEDWKEKLVSVETASALDFVKADWQLGNYIGDRIREFLIQHKLKPDFIASHGHTIFHQPDKYQIENSFTAQIGNGACIATRTSCTTINDFRITDVALGGEGAPLVPIGDELLFGEFDYCLNLGGIANISANKDFKRLAFDVCACNMALNYLAREKGMEFDYNGEMAAEGSFKKDLFDAINQLDFFKAQGPKSLGKEWYLAEVLPLLKRFTYDVQDIAHTFVHHIAYQLKQTCDYLANEEQEQQKMLITGGGAHHKFLIQTLKQYIPNVELHIPDKTLIEFKEALIFAFLGVLRWKGEVNTLASVTGAKKDSIGGAIHLS